MNASLIKSIPVYVLTFALSYSYPPLAGPIVNDITQLNPITVDRVVTPTSTEEISRLVARHPGPISIGGGRYSQGGQIATENCLFIDMRQMDKILHLDAPNCRITVEAGITWRKIQEAIDPKDLSVKIMQTYSNFTVGGSLSVNVHGRYVGEGPLIRSVESLKIVLADGTVKEASRTKNPDLFFGAIGGYGGLGVIVEATLNLTENSRVERVSQTMSISKYRDYFFHEVSGSKNAVFHNADIYPPAYTHLNAVTWMKTGLPVTVSHRLAPQKSLSLFDRFCLFWISDGILGKQFRQYIYDPCLHFGKRVEWRNYEASYDVAGLEPPSREKSTYVLQEYFVPTDHLETFAEKMAEIFKRRQVNVINVSIRHSLADPGSLLAWAKTEVFAFVIYYKQQVTAEEKKRVSEWTSELIEAALSEKGAYYLPYQIIATPEQFFRAYPRAPEYFALKKKVDPTNKFRNKLWDRYYKGVSGVIDGT